MSMPSLDSSRSTCLMACFVTRPRANARPCPIMMTAPRLRRGMQGRGSDDPKGGIGQGHDPFGVQVALEQAFQEPLYLWEAEGLVRFHWSPRESSYTRGDSWFVRFRQAKCDERTITNPDRLVRILYGKPLPTPGFFYYATDSSENEGMHKGGQI